MNDFNQSVKVRFKSMNTFYTLLTTISTIYPRSHAHDSPEKVSFNANLGMEICRTWRFGRIIGELQHNFLSVNE